MCQNCRLKSPERPDAFVCRTCFPEQKERMRQKDIARKSERGIRPVEEAKVELVQVDSHIFDPVTGELKQNMEFWEVFN